MYYDKNTEKVRSEKFYSIGYNSQLSKYVLADVITWISYFERIFEITKEEYDMFGTDELDAIADNLHREGIDSHRFLFSGRIDENTSEQLILMKKARIME